MGGSTHSHELTETQIVQNDLFYLVIEAGNGIPRLISGFDSLEKGINYAGLVSAMNSFSQSELESGQILYAHTDSNSTFYIRSFDTPGGKYSLFFQAKFNFFEYFSNNLVDEAIKSVPYSILETDDGLYYVERYLRKQISSELDGLQKMQEIFLTRKQSDHPHLLFIRRSGLFIGNSFELPQKFLESLVLIEIQNMKFKVGGIDHEVVSHDEFIEMKRK